MTETLFTLFTLLYLVPIGLLIWGAVIYIAYELIMSIKNNNE